MYTQPPPNKKIRYSTQPQQSYPNYPHPVMSNSQYNPVVSNSQYNAYHPTPSHYPQLNYNNPPPTLTNPNYPHPQQYINNQSPALIQPPALKVEQNIDTNSQFFPARQPMAISNNQHSQFDNMVNMVQHEQQQQMWTNQAQIASMFWQQRCMTMLQRFQWFYQRFEILRGEYINLSEQMQKMDSQQQWHNFQQHHDQFHQKIVEMEQQLSAVLGDNQQLLQQKQIQQGQSVWQQRYQQLLGNFKSLQEDMQRKQAGGQSNSIAAQQYQHLQDQFGQLQYQYGQVMNQLQNYRGAQMQINQYLQQIENYKQKLDGLHNQNVQMQQMILELQDKNKQLQQGYHNAIDRSKYDQLVYIIQQKQEQIQQLRTIKTNTNASQSSITQYQTAISSKNNQIDALKQKLIEKDKEINLGISKLQSVETTLTHSLRTQFDHQRYQLQRKITQLQRDLNQIKKESVRSSIQNNKVQSLQKKVQSLNNQITTLNDTLKKKNQQLNELRNISYQLDRLKQNESNHNKVVEEKKKLSETLKKKNAEIEAMHLQMQKLSIKIHEVSTKKQQYSTRNLMIQIQDLSDQLRRYEGEIVKLKNMIELKQQYSQKLQSQLRVINEKYISTQQILLSERQSWKQSQIKLNSKNLQHQKRIKNLDYQFNLQLKDNLQKEVISLRKQNLDKQQTIRTMEQKQILLSSQIAVFQKLKNNFDRDMSLLRKKEKQLQNFNQAQARRFKQLQAAYLSKQNDVDQLKMNQISMSSQLTVLQTQLDDCNTLIKTKNKTIDNLKYEIKQQLSRTQLVDQLMNSNGKLKIGLKSAQQQLQKAKISNKQSKLQYSKIQSRVNSRKDLQKQQLNLINQLQQQNNNLKIELSKLLQKQTSSKSIPHQLLPISPQSKLISLDLNQRLNQFNAKLQHTITQPTLTHSKSHQLIQLWENQRIQLIQKYQQEITRLKQQINQKQTTPVHPTIKTDHSNMIGQSPLRQAYSHLQSQQLREQIIFFRQKYNQQQERNLTLVKINQQLKSKVDSALKIKQGVNASDYYKQQIKLLEGENQVLKNKTKKLHEENKDIKIELSNNHSKLAKNYQLKILQLQLNIQELKRKISYLNAEKANTDNKRTTTQLHTHYNYTSAYQRQTHKTNYQRQTHKNNYQRQVYQPKTYKQEKYFDYLPPSPKNIEQQFQSVLGNLRVNPSPKNNQQSYGPISQIISHTYNDSRINNTLSRIQR